MLRETVFLGIMLFALFFALCSIIAEVQCIRGQMKEAASKRDDYYALLQVERWAKIAAVSVVESDLSRTNQKRYLQVFLQDVVYKIGAKIDGAELDKIIEAELTKRQKDIIPKGKEESV